MNNIKLKCRKCDTKFKVPFIWIIGIEIVLRCPECNTKYITGYKMGAFLLAISLVISLAIANLFIHYTTSTLIPLTVIFIPLIWIYIGYKLRLLWLKFKFRRRRRPKHIEK